MRHPEPAEEVPGESVAAACLASSPSDQLSVMAGQDLELWAGIALASRRAAFGAVRSATAASILAATLLGAVGAAAAGLAGLAPTWLAALAAAAVLGIGASALRIAAGERVAIRDGAELPLEEM